METKNKYIKLWVEAIEERERLRNIDRQSGSKEDEQRYLRAKSRAHALGFKVATWERRREPVVKIENLFHKIHVHYEKFTEKIGNKEEAWKKFTMIGQLLTNLKRIEREKTKK